MLNDEMAADDEAIQHHLDVLSASFDLAAPRRRGLKVAVDCCNGSCSLLAPRWLATLGCEVLAINDDPSSPFPHTPEPKPETAGQVRALTAFFFSPQGYVFS